MRNHRSGSGRWLALTLVTLALAALAAARADAYLYWTDGGGVGTTTIGRANFDGTGVKANFITGDIYNGALAVHGAYIYWPGLNTGRIWRANLSGTGPNQILMSNLDSPTGLAVDGAHIYWAALITSGEFVQTAIGRATLQGGGVTDIDDTFITVPNQPNNGSPADVHGVAVDSNYIYWANSSAGTIGRANLNGQSVDQSFIGGQNTPWGVAVDSAAIPAPDRQIYWTNSAFPGGTVGRAKLSDPTNVDLSIPGFAPTGVAADATHIFWVNRKTNSIGRANLDGTGVAASFMSQGISPTSLAVDALGGACEGREPTLVGTRRGDRLRGTNRRDVIRALGGDDTVAGLGGDDLVCGAGGDDVLRGQGGDDELRGGRGKDALSGGPGDDLHRGGPGDDTCHGGGGRDRKQGC